MVDQLQTIEYWLNWAKAQLADSESPAVDARTLLCACLDCSLTYLMTWPDKSLSESDVNQFVGMVKRRARGEPVAHITGYRDFWDLRLGVSPATLIPRPETELLVELALALASQQHCRLLDLGTGTGAIALALAKENPRWRVTAVDQSTDAIALAEQNGRLNKVEQIRWLVGSWFEPVKGECFDLIVSNPPYVEQDSQWLQQGDVRFEPTSALTAGADGLDDIRIIAQQAGQFLSAGGWLMLEHGYQQGPAIRQLLLSHGFSEVRTECDLNDLERVTLGQWSG